MEIEMKPIVYSLTVYLPGSDKSDITLLAQSPFGAFSVGDTFIPDQRIKAFESYSQGATIKRIEHSVREKGPSILHQISIELS